MTQAYVDESSTTAPPKSPPGPTGSSLLSAYRWLRDPLKYLDDAAERHGDTFGLRVPGFAPMVVFSDPAAVREVFMDNGEALLAGAFHRPLRPFLGDHSILMLDGPAHMRQRKLLLPPFQGERMKAYGELMLETARLNIDGWPSDRSFSMYEQAQAITLRVIARAVFGVDMGEELERVVRELAELTESGSWPPLLVPWMQFDLGPWSPWGRYLRRRRTLLETLRAHIGARREEGPEGREDILSLLMLARDENGNPLSEDELCDELLTLLFAGHETTATSLAWLVRWVAALPEVHDRIRAEVETATENGELQPEQISKLPYLNAVVRESARVSPAAHSVGRILAEPRVVGGYDLPAGTAVVCSMYLAHRRPSLYPNPTEFNPDRFLGSRLGTSEYFPFGGGIRRCIGMAFSTYEMKLVLASIVARTRLELVDREIKVVRKITLRPSRGLQVSLRERDGEEYEVRDESAG